MRDWIMVDIVRNSSAMLPEEDRATGTQEPHTKFREDRFSGSRHMLADRQGKLHTQTHGQTDRQTGRS